MQVEYIRDMHSNYLVIKEESQEEATSYHLKMLLNSTLEGMLPVKLQKINNQNNYYYDITSKQTIKTILETKHLNCIQMKQIVEDIISIIESSRAYLFRENDFILSPEYMYMKYSDHRIYLCHKIGYNQDIKEQMKTLMEYLMNKVDYKDEKAVVLIYALYKVSQEKSCTFTDLKIILDSSIKDDNEEENEMIQFRMYGKDKNEDKNEDINRNNDRNRNEDKNKDIKENRNENIKVQIPKVNHVTSDQKSRNKTKKESYSKNNKEANKEKKLILNSERKKTNNQHINNQKTNDLYINNQNINKKNNNKQNIAIKNIKQTNRYNKKGTVTIPLMLERIQNEMEVKSYSSKTILILIGSIILFTLIFFISLNTGILKNRIGNRLDITKVFGVLIILGSLEGYLLSKILSEDYKITKIKSNVEYVNMNDEEFHEKENHFNILSKKDNTKLKIDDHITLGESEENSANENIQNIKNVKNMKIINTDSIGESERNVNLYESNQENAVVVIKNIDSNPTSEIFDMESDEQTMLLSDLKNELAYKLVACSNREYADIELVEFPFFIGKLKTNVDFTLEHSAVSRFHVKIERENDDFYVTDLNSTNGTYLNDKKLYANIKNELNLGDELIIAHIKYRFEYCIE